MATPLLYRRALPAAAAITRWRAPDGWMLRRLDWSASRVRGRGSILFAGGRGDFIEKYLELYAHWHARGWSVTAFDWRGQGGSGRLSPDPHVGHVDRFATWIDDLAGLYGDWAARSPGPHVVVGHSMGGHLMLRAMVERRVVPQAAVLVAPMLGLRTRWGARLGERLARTIAALGDPARSAWKAGEIPGAEAARQLLLTHDGGRYADELWWRSANPELVLGPPSWRWVTEAFASTRLLRTTPALRDMQVPTLMLVAEADRLVSADAALAVAARMPDASVVRFDEHSAHEILREVDVIRNRALTEIGQFLDSRAPVA